MSALIAGAFHIGMQPRLAGLGVRLIASDLDGTLLKSDGTVSNRTCDAIRAAERAHIAVVFATARPPRHIACLAEKIGLRGMAVCSNGAVLYDLDKQRTIECAVLEPGHVRYLIAMLRAADPNLALAIECVERIVGDPSFPAFREDFTVRREDLEDAIGPSLIKILVHHPRHHPDTLIALVTDLVAGSAEVIHSGGSHFVDIAAFGISKAVGLERICTKQQIRSSEVVAFGDMPNDLPMLRFAGHSVAVSNAHPEVMSNVDEITLSNDDDGVARVIEELLGRHDTSRAVSGANNVDSDHAVGS